MFTKLLIATCNIQEKTQTTDGYEQVKSWANKSVDVPCRKDSDNSLGISDSEIRLNTDDHIFFFSAGVDILRGDRIVFDSENYDVVKVNKVYDSKGIHHLEVIARYVDHD